MKRQNNISTLRHIFKSEEKYDKIMQNRVYVLGKIKSECKFAYYYKREKYYNLLVQFTDAIGAIHDVELIVSEMIIEQLEQSKPIKGKWIEAIGYLRATRVCDEVKQPFKHYIAVSKYNVYENENQFSASASTCRVKISGNICRAPYFKITSNKKSKSDFCILVRRKYSDREDLIPCVTFGVNTEKAKEIKLGDIVEVEGILQTRKVFKTPKNNQDSDYVLIHELYVKHIEKVDW